MKTLTSNLFHHIPHGFTQRDHPWSDVTQRPDNVIWLTQVHGNKVWVDDGVGAVPDLIEADALVSARPGQTIAVKTADCLPFLVADKNKNVVAAIHAGWKGLVGGVIEATLDVLKTRFHAKPQDLLVALGPCICERCFEVGPEVARQFARYAPSVVQPGNGDRSFVSLKKAALEILAACGVPDTAVDQVNLCTFHDHEQLYSYRKGDAQKRLISFVKK